MHVWSHHVWRCDGGFSLARCHHEDSLSRYLRFYHISDLTLALCSVYVHRCMYAHAVKPYPYVRHTRIRRRSAMGGDSPERVLQYSSC